MNSPLISRADLLRCKLMQKALDLDYAEAALGFFRENTTPVSPKKPEPSRDIGFFDRPSLPSTPPELPPIELKKAHFYRVTKRERLKEESETSTSYPQWYEAYTETLTDEARTSLVPKHLPLKVKPLTPWSRLWPFLHKTLGYMQSGNELDTDRLVRKLANGELIRRIPFKAHYRWSGSARLLIDINSHIFPLRHDVIFLHNKLTRLRGTYGLHIQYLDDQPGGQVYYWDKEKTVVEQWFRRIEGCLF